MSIDNPTLSEIQELEQRITELNLELSKSGQTPKRIVSYFDDKIKMFESIDPSKRRWKKLCKELESADTRDVEERIEAKERIKDFNEKIKKQIEKKGSRIYTEPPQCLVGWDVNVVKSIVIEEYIFNCQEDLDCIKSEQKKKKEEGNAEYLVDEKPIIDQKANQSTQEKEDYEKFVYKTRAKIYITRNYAKGNQRNKIEIDLKEVIISDISLLQLLRLLVELKKGDGGWYFINSIDDDFLNDIYSMTHQSISRLKEPIKTAFDVDFAENLIENNSRGEYRLSTHPDLVELNKKEIKKHKSERIQQFVKKFL